MMRLGLQQSNTLNIIVIVLIVPFVIAVIDQVLVLFVFEVVGEKAPNTCLSGYLGIADLEVAQLVGLFLCLA